MKLKSYFPGKVEYTMPHDIAHTHSGKATVHGEVAATQGKV